MHASQPVHPVYLLNCCAMLQEPGCRAGGSAGSCTGWPAAAAEDVAGGAIMAAGVQRYVLSPHQVCM
jgi:hypothetical protein